MSRFFDLVSKPARNMATAKSSSPTTAELERRENLIRLDSNESPFGPSARVQDAMRRSLSTSNKYPDDDCNELRLKLAADHQLLPEQVLVTAGSTALLGLLCQTLLAPGLNAVTSECSFVVYAMAVQAAGASLIEAPMREHGFDLDAILATIDANTRIVFLANPNNPTGTVLEAEMVQRFLERLPSHVVLLLDEAYYEFATHFAKLRKMNYSNALDYVRGGLSVVVLRTFSKAHGLAGLRIGYGLGPAELLGYCARMRNTFSVSSVAQAAALASLEDHEQVSLVVESNAIQSRDLAQGLYELGYKTVPTSANFLFCDVGEGAAGFAKRMQDEGVAVRPLGHWGAPSCIRVTIGKPEQNRAFLQAVRRIKSSDRAAEPQASSTIRSVV
jgi:histidinol-phosphate aminotransferase